jgi:hypothetical protein
MKNTTYFFIHQLISVMCLKKAQMFHKASKNTLKTQKKILKSILQNNAQSSIGQKNQFSHIKTISGYLAKVPLTTYEDYQTYIHLTSQGKDKIICEETINALTLTPPINGNNHHIPLNESFKNEKNISLSAWLHGIISQLSGKAKGSCYFYQPPILLTRKNTISSTIPVQPENKLDYLSPSLSKFINAFQAVPDIVRHIKDCDIFRYVTLLFLLKDSNIQFMSISHPSFLIQLFQLLEQEYANLIEDIARGDINDRFQIDSKIKIQIMNYITPDNDRAKELRDIFLSPGPGKNITAIYHKIWPKLHLITCQPEGLMSIYQQYLKSLLPDVLVQEEGLFTPEGALSIPVKRRKGQLLAVASHFFEFIDIDSINKQYSSGKLTTLLSHELKEKQFYKVLITNGAGLYRYELPYIVRVVKDSGKCPFIELICHNHCSADIQGERIYELDLLRIVHKVFRQKGVKPCFYMIAPEKGKNNQDFYVLFLQFPNSQKLIDKKLLSLMELIEKQLCNLNNYAQYRGSDQLGPLGIFLINPDSQPTLELIQTFQTDDQVLGHVIPSIFYHTYGLTKVFSGQFMTRLAPQPKTTPKKQAI